MKATKSVKSVAQKSVKAVSGAVSSVADKVATATVEAIVLALDTKANHSMRIAASKLGADLFATHSEASTSKGYLTQLSQVDRSKLFKDVSKGDVRLLIVNGVCNIVRIDKDGAFYGRNGKLVVRDFNESQMLHGNVASLVSLYGSKVELLTEEEARKRYDAQKETVTRKVGGKNGETVTGRVIATGAKGEGLYSVVMTLNGSRASYVNCETKKNEYSAAHNYVQEKATASK